MERGTMRVRAVGADALLLEVDDPTRWYAELTYRRDIGDLDAIEIVPGARTVLLDGLTDAPATAEAVRGWTPTLSAQAPPGPLVEIPVTFDGEDLPAVAEVWGTDRDGVVARLLTTELYVAFCGFSPGWAYLAGLPEELAVPRLDNPRPRVPAGSVALADRYAGIYPSPSPGGWRLVGRTEVTLFDPERRVPALLGPGTRVRFVAP